MQADIVVCTRNRAAMLRDHLPLLAAAAGRVPGTRIYVVDNGSTDDTAAVLAELAAGCPAMTVLREPRPGLYFARCCGIGASLADILVFVDDDVVPAPDFLEKIVDAFADPTLGAAGGAIDALYDAPPPGWCSPRLLTHIPVLPLSRDIPNCRWPCYPPGACLAVRRAPCLAYYLAPERAAAGLGLGAGTSAVAYGGDDTDLCEIYARAGYRIARLADVRVSHRTPASRLTPAWFVYRFAWEGRTRVRLARLRNGSPITYGVPAMLAAFPVLALLRPLTGMMGQRLGVTVMAYFAKSRAAWQELLFGRRDRRLPYPAVATDAR